MALVLAECVALESDVAQKISRDASNEHLDRFLGVFLALAFPCIPTALEDLIDMALFEFCRDEEARRRVEYRIGSDKKAKLSIYPYK